MKFWTCFKVLNQCHKVFNLQIRMIVFNRNKEFFKN